MLDNTLTTQDAYFSFDKDAAEIYMNSLSDMFRYELLCLKDKWYIEMHSLRTGGYLGYVKKNMSHGQRLKMMWEK